MNIWDGESASDKNQKTWFGTWANSVFYPGLAFSSVIQRDYILKKLKSADCTVSSKQQEQGR